MSSEINPVFHIARNIFLSILSLSFFDAQFQILSYNLSMFESIVLSIVSSGFIFTIAVILMDRHHGSKRHRGGVSDHFDGKKFYNISWNAGETFRMTETEEEFFGKKHKNGLLSFCKWILNQKISLWKNRKITPVKPAIRHDGTTTRVTYIGHATVLIQTHGINLLTDPIWSKRASPVQWA